jgi:hypothetical protein
MELGDGIKKRPTVVQAALLRNNLLGITLPGDNLLIQHRRDIPDPARAFTNILNPPTRSVFPADRSVLTAEHQPVPVAIFPLHQAPSADVIRAGHVQEPNADAICGSSG